MDNMGFGPDPALAVPATPLRVDGPSGCDPGYVKLPPFLRAPDRRPERDYYIAPDILRIEHQSKTQHDNCWTIHYVWMSRIWGFFDKVEIAHVNSRRYRQWLETYDMKDGIPPHIQFGAAVVSGKGDPEFYNRWVAYARATFA